MNTHISQVKQYCNSLVSYSRRKTRVVNIGDVPLGGEHPIRVQSMTTVDTMDTKGSVEQVIRMVDAGCEYVRITAPSLKEAQNLEVIKKELRSRGYTVPLIADIHFTPNAAELAARVVEKVRINPGNYADKKRFEEIDYTEASYRAELDRIRQKFTPLVKICKEYGTAMRIGTNHGSLSDRIMSRYGDTPLGMVESALEFLRVCEDQNFYNIVLSMKSSNPQVMVQAYRLLVQKLDEEGFQPYPLHLGVTEAGDGEDGRIKSSVGIGTLLEDGLGDTVRVSLTEEPEAEVPVAQTLVSRYNERSSNIAIPEMVDYPINPFAYTRRVTNEVLNFGGHQVPRVVADLSLREKITPASFFALGYHYSVPLDKWNIADIACDYVFVNDKSVDFDIPGTLGIIYAHKTWLNYKDTDRSYPFILANDYLAGVEKSNQLNFIYACLADVSLEFVKKIKTDPTVVLLIDTYHPHGMAEQRRLFVELIERDCRVPVVIGRAYRDLKADQLQIFSGTDIGGLLIDGLGDGVFIAAENCGSDKLVNETAFNILQATRTRISKTEYISCPSCGRTLFDLQETTAKIRARTSHLKGVKIGIMGCIVNGPGEMADADYGYVGSGPGRITLYKGKEVVKKNVPTPQAVDELINLIRDGGDWIDMPMTNGN
ncbi:MAG: (E)-4-hydroxy-3-methylbut-2-enyl-diphosphate synthase [Cytophagales bacterium]|nr:(E)-4-hydroxy-3-methylbut-2-enyl-diphosphate synthase [Cytophagales bacterium]MCA6388473.1 (E)-4-hydroxy-3-methylbut-2-enyl-diphosphate synthase [Cytophagales bacterium]MCA6390898.1 (E)-4-hydroxy-3-methylbut-2-enyl-diphosphate synthase [Cytophagales bacterium]MCA6394877.1 (E)-4-hydroxy-3-methylbut-2-enyl-diphosphate synthase [Cytophagales bacterium]MCA6399086.1 (E)-4-hydroxy-3-methylbut-2-enyl-diphosphate synthase [Cytophagales bacterium]